MATDEIGKRRGHPGVRVDTSELAGPHDRGTHRSAVAAFTGVLEQGDQAVELAACATELRLRPMRPRLEKCSNHCSTEGVGDRRPQLCRAPHLPTA